MVWDATDAPKRDLNAGVGHVVNSRHPSLPRPFSVANAIYQTVLVNMPSGEKVRRGVVAVTKNVPGDAEILTDYHWNLEGRTVQMRDPTLSNAAGVVITKEYRLHHQCANCTHAADSSNVMATTTTASRKGVAIRSK